MTKNIWRKKYLNDYFFLSGLEFKLRISTKNLATFKRWDGGTEKFDFYGEFKNTPIYRGIAKTSGPWTVRKFKMGLGKIGGGVFFLVGGRWEWYPKAH